MRIALLSALAYVVILAGCGGDSNSLSAGSPTPTQREDPSPISPPVASPSPYPTPVPALTPIVSTGWAIAMFDDGLYATAIDRTGVAASDRCGERISLTTLPITGPRGATYAGSIVDAGETWVYAVEVPSPETPSSDATLVRTSLSDGRQETILTFKPSLVSRDGILLEPQAAISPDGVTSLTPISTVSNFSKHHPRPRACWPWTAARPMSSSKSAMDTQRPRGRPIAKGFS